MAPLSILIVGCGVAGPTLASFLLLSDLPANEKPHITILERASTLRSQGQNIDIRGAGATIIRKLGLESTIRAAVTGEEGAQFVDEQNRTWAAFPADKSGKIQTGTSDIEILRGRLAQILLKKSEEISEEVQKEGGAGIEYILGDYLDEIDQDGQKVNVKFAKSGQRRSFDILVGCDGLQSRTRNMVWGPKGEDERVKRLGMYGGFFSCPAGETDTEWRRWFHSPGAKGIMVRPSDEKSKVTMFLNVISEDQRLLDAARDGRKGVQTQKALMREYFQDAGWECDRVLREMDQSDDFYYDMIAQVRLDKWNKGRVVLLGDAGYCASPVSGMGTTLGLNGAYNLAGALLKYPNDHEAAFALYQERMTPTVQRAQKLAPGFPHLMYPQTAWGVSVLRYLVWFIWRSGVANLVFKFAGPPANEVKVDEYGFREQPDTKVG